MEEQVYVLPYKVSCAKHPSKVIEYFSYYQNQIGIYCSSCLFKKEYNQNVQIQDISEFLYQKQQMFEKKGLSDSIQVYDYIINKAKREHDYKELTGLEYRKFETECDELLDRVQKTITSLKISLKSQFEEYNQNYSRISNKLLNTVQENFQSNILSKFENFSDIFHTFDITQQNGLQELLDALVQDKSKNNIKDQIQYNYKEVLQLEKQIPVFDTDRFTDLKNYFNVFHDKLQASCNLLVNISNQYTNNGQEDEEAELIYAQNQKQIDLVDLRKISCSANFNSMHQRTVYCIQKLQNKKFATGSDDGVIKIWDQIQMEQEINLKGHTGGIRSLAALPNGNLASASYDKTIKIWNPFVQINNQSLRGQNDTSPYLVRTLTGHLSSVLSLKSLGNNFLASGSADYTIKIWDTITGEIQKTLSGHMNDVLCMATTRASNTLISGSSDKTIKLWNLSKKFSSACQKTLTGHTDFVWSICVCPDDQTLVSGSVDKTVKLWNLETGEILLNLAGHTSSITGVYYYSEGIILTSSGDSTLRFWDITLKMVVHTLEGHKGPIYAYEVMEDNSIISSGQDRQMLIWD